MSNSKHQLLFIGESKYQKYSALFWQGLAIAIIVYCGFHFTENPPVVSIVILFLLLACRLSGHGILLVYNDSIEIRVQNSLLPFFTKKWQFAFEEIIAIDSNLQFGKKEQALADVTNSSIISMSTWNTIKFKLAVGKEKTISTKVYKADIIKAFAILQKASKKTISITQHA